MILTDKKPVTSKSNCVFFNSHSSVFDNASYVHLLSDPMNDEDNVCGLRGSVLRRGLLDVTPMEPRSTAGGWKRKANI